MVQETKIPMQITTNTVYLGEQPVGAVNSVNSKTGDVYLYADDIDFADGQSFQEKLDAGLLKGEKGDTGAQGIQGEKGLDGAKGEKGDTGQQGLKGDTGQQGEQGLKGDKGEQGEQGLKGDTGQAGTNGTNGTDGKDGLTTQLTINTTKYTQVDGNITLPVVDMVVTAEDGTTTTYKVVANV